MGELEFNREMLVLARQARGLTQEELAERIGASQARVSKIENGLDEPDAPLIGRLSAELGFRPSFFAQRTRIQGFPPYHHRKRARLGAKVLNAIHAEMNIRRMHVEALVRSAEIDVSRPLPSFDLEAFDGDAADAARTLREHWLLPPGPVIDLTRVVEDAGVLVLLCDFGTDLLDGLSLRSEGLPPLIMLRADLSGDRYRFTLAHELGHLVLHYFNPAPDERMEREADLFASAFLMPADDAAPFLGNLSVPRLMALKKAWRVSMQAILKRAEQLGKVSQVEAERLWRQIARAGYRRAEPIEIPREQPSLLREIVAMHVEDLGYSADDLSRTLHVPVDAFVRTYLWAAHRSEGPAPSPAAARRPAGAPPSDDAPETRLRLVK